MKFLFLIPVLAAFSAFAQEQSTITAPTPEPVPEQKVLKSVGANIQVPELEFELQNKTLNREVKFTPNQGLNVGVDVDYDGYSFGVSAPLPPDKDSIEKKGKTNHLDLMFGRYWESVGFDLYYQTYSSFYVKEAKTDDYKDDDDAKFALRSDVKSQILGGNFYYAFSPEKYPLKSLTSYDERGKDGKGGSAVLLASLNEFRIGGDQPLIPGNSLLSARLRALSVGGGYGYLWRRNGHQLSGHALFGYGPQDQLLNRTTASESRMHFANQFSLNAGYGYRIEKWLLGFNLSLNRLTADVGENEELKGQSLNVKMFGSLAL